MSLDLIALTSMSGLPLLTKRVIVDATIEQNGSIEELKEISLNTIATLYGLNLFSRLNECDIQLAKSSTGQIRLKWKSFRDNITLIVVANSVEHLTDSDLETMVELIFHSILMVCSLTGVTESDPEKLKRNLKLAQPLISYLLDLFISQDDRLAVITQTIPYALTTRSSSITSIVNSISRLESPSNFAALFVNQKLFCASKSWWQKLIPTKDAFLISCLINSFPKTDQITGMTIYLPYSNPTVPLRLVVSELQNATLALICDKYPTLEYLENEFIIPLNEDEKLNKVANELQHTGITPMVLQGVFGKRLFVLSQLNSFVYINYENGIHFVFNEQSLRQYFTDVAVFAEFGLTEHHGNDDHEEFFFDDDICLYKVARKDILVCVLFENNCSPSIKQMNSVTTTLIDILCKAKHFWP